MQNSTSGPREPEPSTSKAPFDWTNSIAASLLASIIFSIASVVARNVSNAPRAFTLLVGGALIGTLITSFQASLRSKFFIGVAFLGLAALFSPWIIQSGQPDHDHNMPPAEESGDQSTDERDKTTSTSGRPVPTTAPKPAYAYSSGQLHDTLLTASDIARTGFLNDVKPVAPDSLWEQTVLPGWACRPPEVRITTLPSEDEQAEYAGTGYHGQRNIGSELMQFPSTQAADQFTFAVESIAPSCGMTVRMPGQLAGVKRVLRLRDPERKSGATDRVFFQKQNIVG